MKDNLFDVIYCTNLAIVHGRKDRIFEELNKKYNPWTDKSFFGMVWNTVLSFKNTIIFTILKLNHLTGMNRLFTRTVLEWLQYIQLIH